MIFDSKHNRQQECIPVGRVQTAAVAATRCQYQRGRQPTREVLAYWGDLPTRGCLPTRRGVCLRGVSAY